MPRTNVEYEEVIIDRTPYCFWDADIKERNLEFLNSIDPLYHQSIADIYADHLDGEQKQYAATALRAAYSLGLESLFALLCSAIQSPLCAVGWVLKYQNYELRSVVEKVTNSQSVPTRLNLSPVSWQTLAKLMFSPELFGEGRSNLLSTGYARLWTGFASDFLNEISTSEYNSIKHGLRVRMGGFSMSMGIQPDAHTPASPEAMVPIGGSVFGTSFFLTESLSDQKSLRHNFQVRMQSINWNPAKFVDGLYRISASIQSVVAFLKILNGETETENIGFGVPVAGQEETFFTELWQHRVGGVLGSNFSPRYSVGEVSLKTREQIMEDYSAQSQEHEGELPQP